MKTSFQKSTRGYTIVELMVTIVIVAALSVTVGVLFVKLLAIQEREREEAYIREKLTDVCGAYADMLSIGSSILTTADLSSQVVKYRQETGGVSLETGLVSRVAYLASSLNTASKMLDLKAFSLELGDISRKLTRRASGDAALLPVIGDVVNCKITPLGIGANTPQTAPMNDMDRRFCEEMISSVAFQQVTNAALGLLQITAAYKVKNDDGETVTKNVEVERVVRLWNKE